MEKLTRVRTLYQYCHQTSGGIGQITFSSCTPHLYSEDLDQMILTFPFSFWIEYPINVCVPSWFRKHKIQGKKELYLNMVHARS